MAATRAPRSSDGKSIWSSAFVAGSACLTAGTATVQHVCAVIHLFNRSMTRTIGLGLCASQLAGCIASFPRDSVPQEYASIAKPPGYSDDIRIWGDSYASYPTQRLVRFRDERLRASKVDPSINLRELNALTLSGGGSNGAFGAGILAGWAKSGTEPKFDIVTGISAGALIAPFVFVGPAYDGKLKEGFTKVTDASIFTRHGILGALSSGSFTDNAPLARMLDENVTDQFLDKVATEYSKGRRLFIGTTNLDADRAVIWDMGAIAASGRPDRRKLFAEVLLASTSVPGFFPPVNLEVAAAGKTYHEMHVDGGTANEVFLMPAGLTLGELKKRFHSTVKASLYVIRNGRTTPEYSSVEPTLPSIAEKAISSLIKTQGIGDLYRLYAISRRDGIDYNYIDIPGDFTVKETDEFDRKFMTALYEKGFQMGLNGVPWKKVPPGYVQ
ncbi:patatin-like phospholipase family protein [Mesorhizobium sp. B1-1-8]|uniref:patatin-like phospholipase family protein n=1 Tax=Mesorhizobium sp. B1-1-8 TaxID=2589976 RepID=UPI00112D6C9C|nr:patatin-like phospholipase family protein [Mesorhizobium sp. B1-1-8]UCI05197.1 patatin-like phospholipase family protein [Mesorhizobium sp. B1-1-8]